MDLASGKRNSGEKAAQPLFTCRDYQQFGEGEVFCGRKDGILMNLKTCIEWILNDIYFFVKRDL